MRPFSPCANLFHLFRAHTVTGAGHADISSVCLWPSPAGLIIAFSHTMCPLAEHLHGRPVPSRRHCHGRTLSYSHSISTLHAAPRTPPLTHPSTGVTVVLRERRRRTRSIKTTAFRPSINAASAVLQTAERVRAPSPSSVMI